MFSSKNRFFHTSIRWLSFSKNLFVVTRSNQAAVTDVLIMRIQKASRYTYQYYLLNIYAEFFFFWRSNRQFVSNSQVKGNKMTNSDVKIIIFLQLNWNRDKFSKKSLNWKSKALCSKSLEKFYQEIISIIVHLHQLKWQIRQFYRE